MRARDEHRKLSSTNFSFHTDSEGREYLLYSEGVSTTNQSSGAKLEAAGRMLTPSARNDVLFELLTPTRRDVRKI